IVQWFSELERRAEKSTFNSARYGSMSSELKGRKL
ncbi:unnamed protein product, partial [Litomosoides sigmodontis]